VIGLTYFIFPNTKGQKIIYSETEPAGKINGFPLISGDVWIVKSTGALAVYTGSAFVTK
jgi:hypothetical protein